MSLTILGTRISGQELSVTWQGRVPKHNTFAASDRRR